MYLHLVGLLIQTLSNSLRQPILNTSSKSVHTHISTSSGTIFKDKFLALSNRHGLIICCLTITPKFFKIFTVLSVEPVSKAYISSASFIDSYQRLTNFSSFLHMVYTIIFINLSL